MTQNQHFSGFSDSEVYFWIFQINLLILIFLQAKIWNFVWKSDIGFGIVVKFDIYFKPYGGQHCFNIFYVSRLKICISDFINFEIALTKIFKKG